MKTPDVAIVGLSHRTAPVEVREGLAFREDELGTCLSEVRDAAAVSELAIVSTCNRVEIYMAGTELARAAQATRSWLTARAGHRDVSALFYECHGGEAVRHAFRVAASLDSMIIGEAQILGQMKQATTLAREHGALGGLLERCFSRAFGVAKRVRTETGIAAGSVSVSSIACELAQKVFGTLEGKRVALLGAGKMSESAAKYLKKRGASLFVLNRSPARAEELARLYGGHPRSLDDLETELVAADVVIASTASQDFIVTPAAISRVMKARRHRMLLLIDISVPRNIDPRVGTMDNIFLYDVDDLQKVSDDHLAQRCKEAASAERIVEAEAVEFERWRASLSAAPVIVAIRERGEQLAKQELERVASSLGQSAEAQATRKLLEQLANGLVSKLLHAPSVALRAHADDPSIIRAAEELFGVTRPSDAPKDTKDTSNEIAASAAAPSANRKAQ